MGPRAHPVAITTDAGAFHALLAGFGRSFMDLSALLPVEMVLLMEPALSFTAATGMVGPTGVGVVPVTIPDNPAVWGGTISLQTMVLRAGAQRPFVIGNVRDAAFVP